MSQYLNGLRALFVGMELKLKDILEKTVHTFEGSLGWFGSKTMPIFSFLHPEFECLLELQNNLICEMKNNNITMKQCFGF